MIFNICHLLLIDALINADMKNMGTAVKTTCEPAHSRMPKSEFLSAAIVSVAKRCFSALLFRASLLASCNKDACKKITWHSPEESWQSPNDPGRHFAKCDA
jgi:hypothetical protein